MKCPICKREVKLDDPFMPFCSARCKDVDLGNWAEGKYSFEGSGKDDESEGEPVIEEEHD
jgi:uncharacterized protein